MEPIAALHRNNERRWKGRKMFRAISNWFGRLFAPKGDDYKRMLMADLGIER